MRVSTNLLRARFLAVRLERASAVSWRRGRGRSSHLREILQRKVERAVSE
jgi:ribosomal protein L32E